MFSAGRRDHGGPASLVVLRLPMPHPWNGRRRLTARLVGLVGHRGPPVGLASRTPHDVPPVDTLDRWGDVRRTVSRPGGALASAPPRPISPRRTRPRRTRPRPTSPSLRVLVPGVLVPDVVDVVVAPDDFVGVDDAVTVEVPSRLPPDQRRPGVWSDEAVDLEACDPLEVADGLFGARPEVAVDIDCVPVADQCLLDDDTA